MIKEQNAFYSDQKIEDYKGNPFIEALPPIASKEEVIDIISAYPVYLNEDRLLDENIRIHIIQERLNGVFQPLPRHIDLERKISMMIRSGYVSRNPVKREYVQSFINGYKDINRIYYKNDRNLMTANSLSIIGMSGLGKTRSINVILNSIPQVIKHTKYNGKELDIKQVPWIKIDCTYDGSIKGLLLEFFAEVDYILGTSYFEKYGTGKRTTDTLLNIMAQVSRSIGLGLLVIDEIQHLSQAKSGGAEKMLNFFTTLVNVVGIPVIFVGTMAARFTLQNDFRISRRNMGYSGNVIWDKLNNDESWDLLIKTIWRYQYTKKQTELTKEISDLIYYESQGIIDIAIKIISIAQIETINTGREEITVDIIKKVVDKNMTAIKPMMTALKSGSIREIAKYKDICTQDFEEVVKSKSNDLDLKLRIDEYKDAKKKKCLDKKDEALIKLLELDINKKKAIMAIDNILNNDSSISVNKLIIEAIKEVDKIKITGRKEVMFNEHDIRKIASLSTNTDEFYYKLLEVGYICNAEYDWESSI